MKATEKIELIKRRAPWIRLEEVEAVVEEQRFLLKALEVALGLAITYHEAADRWPTGKNLEMLESEFDERMKPFMDRVECKPS